MTGPEKLEAALLLAGIRAQLGRCYAYVVPAGDGFRVFAGIGPARHATAAWLSVAADGTIFRCVRGGAATLAGHVRDLYSAA